MAILHSVRQWLRLPGRVALILGLGALSTAGAQAGTPESRDRADRADVLIRSEGGKIYLSEGGGEFQELQLRDTAEARHLKQLVDDRSRALGSAPLRLNPTILAGGGGAGFHWWVPSEKTDTPGKTGAPDKADASKKTGAAHKTDTTGAGKKE
jgi:hypothetical protein